MALQMLGARAVRRIEFVLNPPRPFHCVHNRWAQNGILRSWLPEHRYPKYVNVTQGNSNGGYTYYFTVLDLSHPERHRHGWMDLKLWRAHARWWWDGMPGTVHSDCLYKLGLPEQWRAQKVWGWSDVAEHWASCYERFPQHRWDAPTRAAA